MQRLRYTLRFGFLFVGALFLTTLGNIAIWGFAIHGKVYYQAPFWNPGGLDYILWINNWIHEGATVVESIDTGWTFKDPQQALEGWNNSDLMTIWMIMFVTSIVVSIVVTWWLGTEKKTPNKSAHTTAGNAPI